MKSPVFPLGTIPQHLYLEERLRLMKTGNFLEVGCGKGFVSKLLLDLGWSDVGYDSTKNALIMLHLYINSKAIAEGRYRVENQNFLSTPLSYPSKFNSIISCMVFEHFNDDEELAYFEQARRLLIHGGKIIILTPGCPGYWGYEDEIAGHYRRYTRDYMKTILMSTGYRINKLVGLTYPISEFLVKRLEYHLRFKSKKEKTKLSGYRHVQFKTVFPSPMRIFLNELTMYPFHILQKLNQHNPSCLVLYAEATRE